jgi:hypothetical protein
MADCCSLLLQVLCGERRALGDRSLSISFASSTAEEVADWTAVTSVVWRSHGPLPMSRAYDVIPLGERADLARVLHHVVQGHPLPV